MPLDAPTRTPHPPTDVSPPTAVWRGPLAAAVAGGVLLALALGAALATAWGGLAAAPQATLLLLGLGLLLLAGWRLQRLVRRQGRHAGVEIALQRERLQRLERRARQLDEAENLVSLGSFDWAPGTGELHWSEQHYRLWGYEPGTVTPSLDLFQRHLHPDDAERVSAELQRALRGECRYDCRHRVRRSDGSVRDVHGRGEVFFDAQGQPERMIGAVLDITERVQAEASLRLHAFVLDAITDPVGVIDADTRYRLANRAWLAINARTLDETIGRSIDEIYKVVVSAQRRQMVLDCLAGKPVSAVRSASPSPHARDRRIETRYFPFRDPAVDWHGAVMISRDVTEDEAVRDALTTSVGNLSLTLNTIGDAIFASDAIDPDQPVLFANDQLLSLWRITLAEGQALTPRLIVDHARQLFRDPDAATARIADIIRDNLSCDDRIELNDGRVLMRRARSTPREPRPVRVWAFRDITAETQALRALAEAEARQRTLLAAFPGFIWVVDADLRLVYLNPPAAEVYRPRVPQPGQPIGTLFGDAVMQRIGPAVQRALAGETLSLDWHRPSASGRSPDDLLIKMVPGLSTDGRPLCYAFGIDISSLKQAEAALVAARDEAERANQAKTQFLSSMSHELRTPLNAVIGFSQVLEMNAQRNLSDKQVRQLGEIRRAGNHLLALINDLLDMARIEAGRTTLALDPVPLADVADECLQLVQPMAASQRQALSLLPALPLAVMADRMRLKQVLLNLLSNAIKYNRPGGDVRLGWHVLAERVEIEVHDQGAGLSPESQSRLFQPFERLDADAGTTVGTGIGLALSRQLVLLMGGTIGVRSTVGEGSCFWVRLQPARPWLTQPARLMYIDDNPVNLALMEGLFEGHETLQLVTSADPQTALARLLEDPVDVLLLDLQMPTLDGFELYQRLQQAPATQALPVVAVSADVTDGTRERCRDLGFIDYVTKPVDAARLFAAVERALERSRGPAGPELSAASSPT